MLRLPGRRASSIPLPRRFLAPFGANLFHGNFAGTYNDGLNGDYVILPGDRIMVRVWGAKTYNDVLPVDQQGNIFLPEVGPVHVAGLRQSALQGAVKARLASVFTDNVNIYVNLQSSQPVAVYVTGFVNQPGRYAGGPMDSVMSYLDRAGGITPNRGTFRKVQVKRGNKVVASLDLYDFALNGNMPDVRLKDGDVILVGERGVSVAAYGMLRQEARYEFSGAATGSQLIRYGSPLSSATHVSVSGIRAGKPFNEYMTLQEFSGMRLADGDSVEFVADTRGPHHHGVRERSHPWSVAFSGEEQHYAACSSCLCGSGPGACRCVRGLCASSECGAAAEDHSGRFSSSAGALGPHGNVGYGGGSGNKSARGRTRSGLHSSRGYTHTRWRTLR